MSLKTFLKRSPAELQVVVFVFFVWGGGTLVKVKLVQWCKKAPPINYTGFLHIQGADGEHLNPQVGGAEAVKLYKL